METPQNWLRSPDSISWGSPDSTPKISTKPLKALTQDGLLQAGSMLVYLCVNARPPSAHSEQERGSITEGVERQLEGAFPPQKFTWKLTLQFLSVLSAPVSLGAQSPSHPAGRPLGLILSLPAHAAPLLACHPG